MADIEAGGTATREELLALYGSVGWTAYTADPGTLERAVKGSSFVVTARRDGRLVGLARAVSDDVSICYLQDVLVAPDVQRTGLGAALVRAVLDRYAAVRQKVLITDTEPRQRAFYESLGLTEVHDLDLRAFVKIG